MAAVTRVLKGLWPSATNTDDNHSVTSSTNNSDKASAAYNSKVEEIRQVEYPTLLGTTYLDHAGTTPYAKIAIERWTGELTTNLFGNPHSASASSQLSARRVDDIRLKVLKFFNASPEDFDIVFVANATAAIKLVAEAFRDSPEGFWYGYHGDAHTSLVGCREMAAKGTRCFEDDQSVESWIAGLEEPEKSPWHSERLRLFAYPGQSNMTGRRLPLEWCCRIRAAAANAQRRVHTLLDAASLVSTSPLDLSNSSSAPDFVALSFYKIFGFPDLGALIVRKDSGSVLMQKRYFAGGTVDAVVSTEGGWHAKKVNLHSALEEGTLPFHNVLALDHAMAVHAELFGSMRQVSGHSRYLAQQARIALQSLRHTNGAKVCETYGVDDRSDHGPLVGFNLKDSMGKILSASEVEKLCIVKGIQLRTGGLCNPGGIARHLGLSAEHIRSNYDAGRRCGGENDMIDGMPTGVIRISFGAMSTRSDLDALIGFLEEFYVERHIFKTISSPPARRVDAACRRSDFFIESLSVFPIKSCAAFRIPPNQKWQVTPKGLAWDREWCLVHEGTNVALSQKRYPHMALLQPTIDLENCKLRVLFAGHSTDKCIEIDLHDMPSTAVVSAKNCSKDTFRLQDSKVCGDTIPLHLYTSDIVNSFFSEVLGVPCCLGRYSRGSSPRHASIRQPKSRSPSPAISVKPSSMMLANESPMLIVSRSSVNELNKQIQNHAQKRGEAESVTVSASSFRANIVVAEYRKTLEDESPYSEDDWSSVSISPNNHNSSPAHATYPATRSHRIPTRRVSDCAGSSSSIPSVPESFGSSDLGSSATTNHTDTSSLVPGDPVKYLAGSATTTPLALNILGPCQRCQMVSINQTTALSQQEPFSTLAKTRRKGDGRVWFGVHAALDLDGSVEEDEVFLRVGDIVMPQVRDMDGGTE